MDPVGLYNEWFSDVKDSIYVKLEKELNDITHEKP